MPKTLFKTSTLIKTRNVWILRLCSMRIIEHMQLRFVCVCKYFCACKFRATIHFIGLDWKQIALSENWHIFIIFIACKIYLCLQFHLIMGSMLFCWLMRWRQWINGYRCKYYQLIKNIYLTATVALFSHTVNSEI